MVDTEPVAQRAARRHRAAKSHAARDCPILAGSQARHTGPLIGRINALHKDQTGQRVCAIATALRTPEDFNLLNIEKRRNCANSAEVDVIDQEAYRWIRRTFILLEFTNTADLKKPGAVSVSRPIDIGKGINQFFEMLNSRLLDHCTVKNRNTKRHLGDASLSKVCSDYDLFERFFRNSDVRKE